MQFRTDQTLVLTREDESTLVFRFRTVRWVALGAVSAVLAVLFGMWVEPGPLWPPSFAAGVLYVFGLMCLYSTCYSLLTRRVLEIDRTRGAATYLNRTPFTRRTRRFNPEDVALVRIHLPPRSSLRKVVVTLTDGEELPLGVSELGVWDADRATELGQAVAAAFGKPLTREDDEESS